MQIGLPEHSSILCWTNEPACHFSNGQNRRPVLFNEIEVCIRVPNCPLDIVAISDQYHGFNDFIYDGIHYGKIKGPLET